MLQRQEFLLSVLFAIIISLILLFVYPQIISGNIKNFLAGVFFVESTTTSQLQREYANNKKENKAINILIVPGHDNDYWGTEFNGVKEADINLYSAKDLSSKLASDSRLNVILARDEYGYNPEIQNYLNKEKEQILKFVSEKKKTMRDLVSGKLISVKTDGVYHNTAQTPVIFRLYGINKWANENDIDIVIHLHMNDYPRKYTKKDGYYSGFSIYVPEQQFSNAKASKDLGSAIFDNLIINYKKSNLPKENAGLIEDQDLIAIGAFNTLDPASILIEYGYIYEKQFLGKDNREKTISEMNLQISNGLINFLEGEN